MRRRKRTAPSKPYDVTTKALIEQNPRAWLEFLGLPVTECEVFDADLSTVSTEADKIIKVTAPILYGVHEEFQASAEVRMPDRLLRYNILAEDKHQMPIHSVVYLLRRMADSFGNLTGVLERKDIDGELMVWFRYRVVRVYEIPVERFLGADPSLLPLALLSNLDGTTPESVVRRMDDRLQQEVTREQARSLWTSAYLLMGLSYPADVTERLLSGVMQMRESVTYQKILSEGRVEGAVREAQNMLLLAGKGPLGAPDAATKKRIHNITEVEALESMVERIHTVGSWADLLK
jgi:predicted transposase YdaD